MKVFTVATALAVASFAAAQLDQLAQLPKCAMQCITQSMAVSGCQATDIECQCGPGFKKMLAVAGPCLCKSTCTTQDLMKAEQISNSICGSAMKAAGKPFTPTPIKADSCQAMAGGAAPPPSYSANPASGNQQQQPSPAPASGNQQQQSSSAIPSPAMPTPPTYGGGVNNMTNVTGTGSAPVPSYTGAAAKAGSFIGNSALAAVLGFGLFAL